MVNIEDFFIKKVNLSTPLFLTFVINMLFCWAYLLGAAEQAGFVAKLVFALSLCLAFGYPLLILNRFLRLLRLAKALYQKHLDSLSQKQLLALLKHDALRPNSRRMVQQTGQRRFSSSRELV